MPLVMEGFIFNHLFFTNKSHSVICVSRFWAEKGGCISLSGQAATATLSSGEISSGPRDKRRIENFPAAKARNSVVAGCCVGYAQEVC
jgi:hypothetical protein